MVALVRPAPRDEERRRRAIRIRLFLIMARASKPMLDEAEEVADEGGGGVPANALLAEDGTPILAEDGSYILV